MDPVIGGALITGGSALAGGIISSAMNVHESRANRRFQREMSNTEVQRRVADMKAAGINPLLAVHPGGGAGTPSGSASHIENPAGAVPAAVSSALALADHKAQVDEMKSRTAANLAQAGKTGAERDFLLDSMDDRVFAEQVRLREMLDQNKITKAEYDIKIGDLKLQDLHGQLLQKELIHSGLDLDRARAESSMYKQLGMFAPLMQGGGPGVSTAAAAASVARLFGRASRGAKVAQKLRRPRHHRTVDTKTGELLD